MHRVEESPQHRLLLLVTLQGFQFLQHIHLHQSKPNFPPEKDKEKNAVILATSVKI